MARIVAVCCVWALAVGGASAAAPPSRIETRRVKIDLVLAKVPAGSVPSRHLGADEAAKLMSGLLKQHGQGGVEVLSQATLITLNGSAACMAKGQELPVEVRGADGKVTVVHEHFGTMVKVLPTVRPNGKIDVEIEPEVSELEDNTRCTVRVHCSESVQEGESFVIATPARKFVGDAAERSLVVIATLTAVTPKAK